MRKGIGSHSQELHIDIDLPAHKEKVGKGWDEEGDWVPFPGTTYGSSRS